MKRMYVVAAGRVSGRPGRAVSPIMAASGRMAMVPADARCFPAQRAAAANDMNGPIEGIPCGCAAAPSGPAAGAPTDSRP